AMTTISIRPATPADITEITAIYRQAVRNGTASFELRPPSEADMTARFEALAAGRFPYLVATDADCVLGYAYAGPYRPRPAYGFTVENSVYVAPDAQGRGIGRMLLGALIEAAEASGFRQ